MSDRKETLYIFDEREPVWKSAARDAVSFGGLVATAVALNRLIPPSAWLNGALAICWILWLAGKGIKRRMEKTPAEAVAWLHEHYPAIATEAATAAETVKLGSVHEGAGRNGIAQTPPQPQSESNQ